MDDTTVMHFSEGGNHLSEKKTKSSSLELKREKRGNIEGLEVALDQNFKEVLVHKRHNFKNIAVQIKPSKDFGN